MHSVITIMMTKLNSKKIIRYSEDKWRATPTLRKQLITSSNCPSYSLALKSIGSILNHAEFCYMDRRGLARRHSQEAMAFDGQCTFFKVPGSLIRSCLMGISENYVGELLSFCSTMVSGQGT